MNQWENRGTVYVYKHDKNSFVDITQKSKRNKAKRSFFVENMLVYMFLFFWKTKTVISQKSFYATAWLRNACILLYFPLFARLVSLRTYKYGLTCTHIHCFLLQDCWKWRKRRLGWIEISIVLVFHYYIAPHGPL